MAVDSKRWGDFMREVVKPAEVPEMIRSICKRRNERGNFLVEERK